MFDWLKLLIQGPVKRAEIITARKHGVSQQYLREVIANIDAYRSGKITRVAFERQAVQLACQYPEGSKMSTEELLRARQEVGL